MDEQTDTLADSLYEPDDPLVDPLPGVGGFLTPFYTVAINHRVAAIEKEKPELAAEIKTAYENQEGAFRKTESLSDILEVVDQFVEDDPDLDAAAVQGRSEALKPLLHAEQ